MNILQRLLNKGLLKKTVQDCNLADEKTSVSALFFSDGFKVKNIKHSALIAKIKENLLEIFNESTNSNYNYIEKKRHDLYIRKIDFYTSKEKGYFSTDLETYTKKTKGIDFSQVNCLFISATSGAGKTTMAKQIIHDCNYEEVSIYSPKSEQDYPEFKNKYDFDETEIIKLTEKIKKFNEDREYRKEINELICIDEFLLLTNVKFAKNLIEEINKSIMFNRATNLRFIFIAQSINKQQLGTFNINIVNTFLLNLTDLQNYQSSIGSVQSKFMKKLPIGKFLKKSLDEKEEVVWFN